MSYRGCLSEKLRKFSADAETKDMLYLMNFCQESSKMNYRNNLVVWNRKNFVIKKVYLWRNLIR